MNSLMTRTPARTSFRPAVAVAVAVPAMPASFGARRIVAW